MTSEITMDGMAGDLYRDAEREQTDRAAHEADRHRKARQASLTFQQTSAGATPGSQEVTKMDSSSHSERHGPDPTPTTPGTRTDAPGQSGVDPGTSSAGSDNPAPPDAPSETTPDETPEPVSEAPCRLCGGTGEVVIIMETGEQVSGGCPRCMEREQRAPRCIPVVAGDFDTAWKIRVCEAGGTVEREAKAVEFYKLKLSQAKSELKLAEDEFMKAVDVLRDTVGGKGQGELPFIPDTEHPASSDRESTAARPPPPAAKEDAGMNDGINRGNARGNNRPPKAPDPAPDPGHPVTGELRLRVDDETWKQVNLGDLELPESTVAALNAQHLFNVGDIAGYCDAHGQGRALTEIPGIGVAKASRIEQALDAQWEKHVATIEREIMSTDAEDQT